MRFKVELYPGVRWFVRHVCGATARKAFYEQLELVCSEPIANSEAYADPEKSRYILRRFGFADYVAIFGYDPARNLIRVVECRPSKQQQRREPPKGNGRSV
jgi:hypothetical protein